MRCAALDPDTGHYGATLTSVRSQEENDYVQSLFNDSGTSFDDNVWIGGTDEFEEGV